MKVYGIFEGGGAKGLAYVGALRALWRLRDIEFQGLAGASVGAITAALVAIGYEHKQLYDYSYTAKAPRGVLDRDLVDLVGRSLYEKTARHVRHFNALFDSRISWHRRLAAWITAPWLIAPLLSCLKNRGIFDPAPVRDWIADLLLAKYKERGGLENGPIKFSHIQSMGVELKIVATDLSTRRMHIFQYNPHLPEDDDDHDPIVAEAVAASIAFPFVFKPYRIEKRSRGVFVDGGLTSNFPYWLFERERADPERCRVPILGFRLVDIDPHIPDDELATGFSRIMSFFSAIANSTTSGAEDPKTFEVRNLHVCRIPVPVSTFDFETADEIRSKIAASGYIECQRMLFSEPIFANWRRVEQILIAGVDLMKARLKAVLSELGLPTDPGIRANVMLPISSWENMVFFTANMSGDADDRLVLRRHAGIAGRVFATRSHVAAGVDDIQGSLESKYERALVGERLRTIFSAPIFAVVEKPDGKQGIDDTQVRATLNLDSPDDILRLFERKETANEIENIVLNLQNEFFPQLREDDANAIIGTPRFGA
jgi:NTE family protein